VGTYGFETGAQEAGTVTAKFNATAQPGGVVMLEVRCSCDATSASATVFGRSEPLFRSTDHWEGLVGIDLDVRPGIYPISISVTPAGSPSIAATHDLTVVERQFPTRRLRVAPTYVDPPQSDLARIKRESAVLQSIFDNAASPRQWRGAVRAPVSETPNSTFGARSIYNGQARSPHSGTDFSARTGTPVAAPATGMVALAEPLYFTGNTVVLDHGLGLYSVLAHLSELRVKAGDRVQIGEVVGLVGATGRVTGPHLHWSVRLNGARVDPLQLMAATKDLLAPD